MTVARAAGGIRRRRAFLLAGLVGVALIGVALAAITRLGRAGERVFVVPAPEAAYASEFSYLSQNGNSNCSKAFRESIASMPDGDVLRGSCCFPMSMHRYSEQRRGLAANYATIPEIPQDPYNIPASLAKQMMPHFTDALTPEQQKAYDYAMSNSRNKGPCCCQCWRWQFFGGLAKYLIETYGFTGQQVTEVWNLSDGCGGEADHVYHG